MSSFLHLGFFVHNNTEAEGHRSFVHADLNYKNEIEHMRISFGLLPHGFWERKKFFFGLKGRYK